MVQINSYTFSQSGQRITPNFSDRTRKIEFQLAGGEGGLATGGFGEFSGSNAEGGNGATISGTYNVDLSADDKFIRVYPGEDGEGGQQLGTLSGGSNYLADGGDAENDGVIFAGGGGAMSAIAIMQDTPSGNTTRTLLAVAGGGGGAGGAYSTESQNEGSGGGGSPGGISKGDSNGEDAETISAAFAQGLGGAGAKRGGPEDANPGYDGSAAAQDFVSNVSTGTIQSPTSEFIHEEPVVDVQTYGLPAPVTDLTTSINSNYDPVLSWTSTDNGILQRVYRKERTENSFSQVGAVGDSIEIFADTSTKANTTYSYKIVQDDNYFQDGNTSIIHTPDERVQVYQDGSWDPATLQTY